MINKSNYFNKVDSIDYNSLPEALQEGFDTIKFGSKDYSTWEYLEDDKEFLDLYFSKLNAFLDTNKPKKSIPNYKGLKVEIRPRSATSKQFVVWDVDKDKVFANEYFKSIEQAKKFVQDNEMDLVRVVEQQKKKSSSAGRSMARKKVLAKKDEAKRVEKIPLEISFIRRYALLHGKVVAKKRLLTLLSSLQKAMLEKRIRKTSAYADEMMTIQDQLIKVIEKMDEQVEISISKANLEKYKAITSSERIRESIALLKRYLSLHGKTEVQEKAKRLKDSMERMVKRGKITKEDPYAKRLDAAYRGLVEYLSNKKDSPKINQGELNGILSLVGGKAQHTSKSKNAIFASQEIINMDFETIDLKGKFKELIGDPSVGFTAMVFGQPKSGESTLMLEFAYELARHHGKVLYAAIEEGFGYTLKEKIQRIGAIHSKLEFAEKLPENLSAYDFVFVDSVSRAGMELEDMVKLKNKYPRTGFVFIFHSTKEGKFRGGNDLAHEVDVIIEVEPGLAKASGRFGVGGRMEI